MFYYSFTTQCAFFNCITCFWWKGSFLSKFNISCSYPSTAWFDPGNRWTLSIPSAVDARSCHCVGGWTWRLECSQSALEGYFPFDTHEHWSSVLSTSHFNQFRRRWWYERKQIDCVVAAKINLTIQGQILPFPHCFSGFVCKYLCSPNMLQHRLSQSRILSPMLLNLLHPKLIPPLIQVTKLSRVMKLYLSLNLGKELLLMPAKVDMRSDVFVLPVNET